MKARLLGDFLVEITPALQSSAARGRSTGRNGFRFAIQNCSRFSIGR